jgi:hypothetical protein
MRDHARFPQGFETQVCLAAFGTTEQAAEKVRILGGA